ncbi:hypothetical protein [Nonomuraea gerenzanensis]|uniref:Uncharacterized protein n=1 Tax=Nonomuraea gerenzanensis TaxID=93944 RepID=A0A1M4EEJ8_9ACTN|nr:hypothetical protein [Nonomuraea gerenzanensis]UBU08865.1 hypothetical protein LCN96_31285 [Nonomuraea gerenzanensis]SBO97230.1 hypothetical protein BN4615_P6746 [Nonomuraea gerenzanensis]
MITAIFFAIAAVSALEITLVLALLGWGGAQLGAFLRHHPHGSAGGLRDLAAEARQCGLLARDAVRRRWESHGR